MCHGCVKGGVKGVSNIFNRTRIYRVGAGVRIRAGVRVLVPRYEDIDAMVRGAGGISAGVRG